MPEDAGDIATTKQSTVSYLQYSRDKEAVFLPAIRELISKDLSEPYSIYVYRYFLYEWPDLCFIVSHAEASLREEI